MDVIELRTDLHYMIDQTTDSDVLIAVKKLLLDKSTSRSDWWKTIGKDEQTEIEQGLAEAEQREVTPHKEVMEKYSK